MRPSHISCPYVSILVFAGFFRCQIAGVADFVNVQACGGELRNLPSAARREFDLEHLRANQAGGGAHVANCGYVTADDARGRGVARTWSVSSSQLVWAMNGVLPAISS